MRREPGPTYQPLESEVHSPVSRIVDAALELCTGALEDAPCWMQPFPETVSLSIACAAVELATGVEEEDEITPRKLNAEEMKLIDFSLGRCNLPAWLNPLELLILNRVTAGRLEPYVPGSKLSNFHRMVLIGKFGGQVLDTLNQHADDLERMGFDWPMAYRLVEERFGLLPASTPVPPPMGSLAKRAERYRLVLTEWPMTTQAMLSALRYWIEIGDVSAIAVWMGSFPNREKLGVAECIPGMLTEEERIGILQECAVAPALAELDQQLIEAGIRAGVRGNPVFRPLISGASITADMAVELYAATVAAIPTGPYLPDFAGRIVTAGELVLPPAEVCRRWAETELRPYLLEFLMAPEGATIQ